jgi:hypothetical protein
VLGEKEGFGNQRFRKKGPPQCIVGASGFLKALRSLYLKLTIGQTPKGEGEKND